MAKVVLKNPRIVGKGAANPCEAEFLWCEYRDPSWFEEAIPEDQLLESQSPILLRPASAKDERRWKNAFSSAPPTARTFEVKIGKRTELVSIAWLPRERLLPIGVTPVGWPTGNSGAYCVQVTERIHWSSRQQLLAIQEMLLELVRAAPGIASTGSPAKVAPSVSASVAALKAKIQNITKKPRDYVAVDEEVVVQRIGVAWKALEVALRATALPDAVDVANRLAGIAFPSSAPTDPTKVGIESLLAVRSMFSALDFAAKKHARQKSEETLRLSTLVHDRAAAREFFFANLESVYLASKQMAPMTTSSTGAPSFQRGVHGAVIEEAFRQWLRARVAPLAVSTGTIVGAPAKEQLDVIIWDPRYIAAVVCVGEVAYVPAPAVRGIMEVKAGYPEPGAIATRLYELQATHLALCEQQNQHVAEVPVVGVLVADAEQYETVAGKGASMVAALFRNRSTGSTDLVRNHEAFERLEFFLRQVKDYST